MKREGLRPLTDDFGKEQHFAPRQSPQTQAYDNSPGRMEPRDSEMHGNIQTSEQTPNGKALAPENTPPFHPHHRGLPPKRLLFGMGFFNQILLCLLILSLNTAIKVTIKWYKDEQARREMEKEYLHSELTFLQNQISPHFFMNTLNNIHALIDINGQNAQLAIVRLSKMMRHLLYESDMGNTTLKKEIEFLESYIDLMKLRVDETIRITFSVPETYPNVKLPPLLLIPFIENAFKHGISYQAKSFIDVSLHLNDKLLTFNCTNSLFEKSTQSDPNSGIGLKNVRKRLDLLFGKTYTLTIDDSNNEFRIKLTIPVYED
ncbi:MAG: histidine kinase [Bacteroidota bacterium]|nr:histidine kinase [Bacteroidota bacterium]